MATSQAAPGSAGVLAGPFFQQGVGFAAAVFAQHQPANDHLAIGFRIVGRPIDLGQLEQNFLGGHPFDESTANGPTAANSRRRAAWAKAMAIATRRSGSLSNASRR